MLRLLSWRLLKFNLFVLNKAYIHVRQKKEGVIQCYTALVVPHFVCQCCLPPSIQYVGETENALCICLTSHRSDIRHKHMEKPVAKPFNSVDHSIKDLVIMVMEMICRGDAEYRRRKESHGIKMIRSLTLVGLKHYVSHHSQLVLSCPWVPEGNQLTLSQLSIRDSTMMIIED